MDEDQVRNYVERVRERESAWRRVRFALFALAAVAVVALLALAIECASELHLA